MAPNHTKKALIGVALGLAALEVVTLKSTADRWQTISKTVQKAAHEHPWVPFTGGFILGHILFPLSPYAPDRTD